MGAMSWRAGATACRALLRSCAAETAVAVGPATAAGGGQAARWAGAGAPRRAFSEVPRRAVPAAPSPAAFVPAAQVSAAHDRPFNTKYYNMTCSFLCHASGRPLRQPLIRPSSRVSVPPSRSSG